MSWVPRVNGHVTVLKRISASEIRRKSGVITGFATDSNPIIRVGRHDTNSGVGGVQYETYGDATTGVARRTDPDENIATTKYISY